MNRDSKHVILPGANEQIIDVKRRCHKNHCLTASILMMVFLSLLGCGKKAPPRPPDQIPLPVVKDLKITIGRDMLWLTWTIPAAEDKKDSEFTGFSVYRSKTAIPESDCKNCPILFAMVYQVPVEVKPFNDPYRSTMSFEEPLEKGFRYIYKVIGHSDDGRVSGDSNLVDFKY
ncbi:MAG TPA: hypothetical protein ENI07_04435 [Desulfobacterales bacterium]|nr:hypothetical protein [Desulfobacterales bacterium]